MNRLDEVVGPLNWQREHTDENRSCTVSIWNEKNNQWVSKTDVGTKSMTEAAKGLASDSFKRACFNWGIGRELYDYPMISIKLNSDELTNGKANYNFKLREWKWISFFKEGKLQGLAGKDTNGKVRFNFGTFK
jgi:hypothetical protein